MPVYPCAPDLAVCPCARVPVCPWIPGVPVCPAAREETYLLASDPAFQTFEGPGRESPALRLLGA